MRPASATLRAVAHPEAASESSASAAALGPMHPKHPDVLWIAIGETTGAAMRAHGFAPLRIAEQPTPEGVVAAVAGF